MSSLEFLKRLWERDTAPNPEPDYQVPAPRPFGWSERGDRKWHQRADDRRWHSRECCGQPKAKSA